MIEEKIADIKRFDQVLKILVENQMGYLIERSGISNQLPFTERLKIKKHDKPGPERLRETLEQLGSIYIKFGQILAQRPDLIPKKYTHELEKLEDNAPPFEWNKAQKIIEEDVGLQKFDEIDQEPIAAASIAQVHRAQLQNGDEVVIKVKRPGIDEQVRKDLEILKFISREAEKHSDLLKHANALKFVEQFSKWTKEELDLEREGLNAQIFRENLEEEENLEVPKVYPDLNTERILVMEHVQGVKCTNADKLKNMDLDAEEIAETAVRAGIRQSIIDGFFHADPHPSNFLLTEDSKIIYLDFGMMGKVSQKTGEKLGLLLIYLIREDIEGILDCLESLGTKTDTYNREKVQDIVEEKVLILKNTSLKQTSITQEMFDLFVKISDYGLRMPSNLALLGKNLVTMEGIALTIYPDFRIQDSYEDIVKNTLREKNSPEDLFEDFSIDMIKNKEMFTKLPSKISKKMQETKPDKIKIKSNQQDLYTPLIVATLIIGASIILTENLSNKAALILGIGELIIGALLATKLIQ